MSLVLELSEEGYEVTGVMEHVRFLAEKANTRTYTTQSWARYDEAVRSKARKVGLSAYSGGDLELSTRFLGADATREVRKQKLSAVSKFRGGRQGWPRDKDAGQMRVCLAYNEGCCTFQNCRYSHVCLLCKEVGHVQSECDNCVRKKPSK